MAQAPVENVKKCPMRLVIVRILSALAVPIVVAAYFASGRAQLTSRAAPRQQAATAPYQNDPSQSTASLELPISFERRVGDLDGMLKKHEIRVLVVPSRSGFFYNEGHPHGIYYEAFDGFQRFVNQKYKTGSLKINVTYIPMRPEQLERALMKGVGDVIGYGVIVTPDREKEVLFTTPIDANVKQVIVTGPKAHAIASLDDLSGEEIYVNPLTAYYQNLQLLSESFQKAGTMFGNVMLQRYLQNTKWVKDATSPEELRKFQEYVQYFKTYGAEYDFDYLMLVAQGYEESGLNQALKNPSGAIGIMQVIPKYAAGPPISIPNVDIAEGNIHASAKMMRNIADTYFKDDKLDPLNKTLMVFASYNAGPNRIAGLRKRASSEGLDPNRWFGNVEFAVAKEVGQETVQYVSNIYKYYVAYKLTLEESETGE
jgi:membrane-bound lytic murein transglycosylase MltF